MTTLAEARGILMGLMRSPGMPTIEQAEDAIDALLAAHLRDLAGTPDSETMERAVEVLVCSPRLDFCSRCGDDGHQCHNCTVAGMWQDAERDLRLAYPLLVAPLRAEVERLKGYPRRPEPTFASMEEALDYWRSETLALDSWYDAATDAREKLKQRLATAEQRVRELENRLHLTRKLP